MQYICIIMYEYTILLIYIKFAYLSYIKNHILYFSFIQYIFDQLREPRLSKFHFSNKTYEFVHCSTYDSQSLK